MLHFFLEFAVFFVWKKQIWSNSSPEYTIAYDYDDFPIVDDEDSLRLGYRNDVTINEWTQYPVVPNTAANTITLNGITSNSQYILGTGLSINDLGNKYYVRPDGNDSNDGLASGTNHAWKTISKAASSSLIGGDSVFIAPGTYNESVNISHSGTARNPIVYYGDRSGNIFSMSAGEILIGHWDEDYIIQIKNQNNVHLENLTVQKSDKWGIKIDNSDNIQVKTCLSRTIDVYGFYVLNSGGYIRLLADTLNHYGESAIQVEDSDNGIDLDINGNMIGGVAGASGGTGTGTGATGGPGGSGGPGGTHHGSHGTGGGSHGGGCDYGIYVENSVVDSIYYNNISKIDKVGIYIKEVSACNLIGNNDIYDVWEEYGIYTERSSCNSIYNNFLSNIKKIGIKCKGDSEDYLIGNIEKNTIHDIWHEHGIFIEKINCNNIINNNIYNINQKAIKVDQHNSYSISVINDNIIHDCYHEGMELKHTGSIDSISANIIYKCKKGIKWDENGVETGSIISDNIITCITNGAGIEIKK